MLDESDFELQSLPLSEMEAGMGEGDLFGVIIGSWFTLIVGKCKSILYNNLCRY